MKTTRFFKGLAAMAMAATLMTSCYDDLELRQEIEGLGNEVEQIKTDLAQLKSDLAALKAAADKDLTVVELNKLADGYEIVFSDGTKAVIKNGKDGKDGLNGTNGKDGVDGTDGKNAVAPVVGVAEDEDGNIYWTVDGEWLLIDGEKVRANAVDGVDGAAGAAGKPGADAKAPVVSIALDEDGYYYWQVDGEWLLVDGEKVRANGIDGAAGKAGKSSVVGTALYNGETLCWTIDNQWVKDSKGNPIPVQGAAGLNGDAFFRSIGLSEDGTKLVMHIINPEYPDDEKKDIVYEIPMGVFNIAFDVMETTGVTTEAKRFNYTISGISAGDEVIVRVLSTNATVYSVVPETNAKGYVEVELPSGEGWVDVYALNNTTGDFKAKSIKVEGTDFVLEETVSALHFSPAGDSVELPLTTGVEYKVEMSHSGENWLTANATTAETRAVSYETLTLSAPANTGAADRNTTVTIRNKANTEKVYATFTINQKNYNPALISDDGEQVEWKESFGLYNSIPSEDAPGIVTKKGTFKFELSDDFSKGAYKVNNLFMAATYYDNGRPVSSQGGVYYADLNDEGNLIVYRANSVASYGFTSDVVLNYDSANKSFSLAEPVEATIYGDGFNRTGYLANYSAVVKVDEPAGGEVSGIEALYGTYNESVKAPYSSGPLETLVISESDNDSYDLKMLFFYTENQTSHETAYGKVSEDGKSITVTIPGGMSNFYGPVSDFTLKVEGTTISGKYCDKMDYSATKVVPFDITSLFGTYNESVKAPYSSGPLETLVISESNDDSYDLKMLFFYTEDQTSHETAYGKVSEDGKSITVTIPGGMSNFYGPVSDFTLKVEGTTISGKYCDKMDYSATK